MDWYNDPKLKAEQKKWYAKLAEEGFHDVEGGVEGHLLRGPTPSMQLGAALGQMTGRLARAKQMMGSKSGTGTPKSDHWYDEVVRDYFDKGKANYYSTAQRIAAISYVTKIIDMKKFTWAMHSDGWGEPVIATELSIPRSRVRKYLEELRERMDFLLDNTIES